MTISRRMEVPLAAAILLNILKKIQKNSIKRTVQAYFFFYYMKFFEFSQKISIKRKVRYRKIKA